MGETPSRSTPPPDDRLDSWKEIANYLGRTERSVRRWEATEGLPVHRLQHDKRGSVYAFRSELDAWRTSRQPAADAPSTVRHWPWVAAALTTLVLTAGLGAWAIARRPGASTPRISALAVLPFENLSRQVDQEWFSDGMTEMLITELARTRSLKVISRTSVMQYRNTRKPLKQIAQELGVDAIVEGSALLVGDRVRISAQLIRAATDSHLWSSHYDGETKDALSLQKEVAAAISQSVGTAVTPAESRTPRSRSVRSAVLAPYLKGLHQLHGAGYASAIDLAREAVRLDPDFAPAHELLGMALIVSADFKQTTYPAIAPEARASLRRTLALEPERGVALSWLGWSYLMLEHDWVQAETMMRQGFELEPRTGNNYAFLLAARARYEEAIDISQQAMLLDPASPMVVCDTAHIYHFARRYDDAVRLYRRCEELDSAFSYAHTYQMMSLLQAGRSDEALEEWLLAPAGHRLGMDQKLRELYRSGGWTAVWRAFLEQPTATGCSSCVDFGLIGLIALGRHGETLDVLEQFERDLNPWMIMLEDPILDPLRDQPRFRALANRVGYFR